MARTLIGNIKGPKGDTGDTGATGATGAAGASASVSVGTVTALEYGNNPTVTNSGSAQNAVFNFGIPKGKPADNITELDNLPVNSSVTPSDDFPVPAVGDTSKTILGKIIKWFGDMSALVATKFNAANVYNGLDKTESGYALDARQGKALNDTKLNASNVVNNLTTTSSGYALDARQGKALSDYMQAHYDSSYELVPQSGTTVALLDTINTLRTQSKVMPFCIQKVGFGAGSVSDLPSNIAATAEFQALVFGSTNRWTVILVQLHLGNTAVFLRNGFQSTWYSDWRQINVGSVS